MEDAALDWRDGVRPGRVSALEALPREPVALWVSCHGYESRSVAHLALDTAQVARRVSAGFEFPLVDDSDAGSRVGKRRELLHQSGFETPVVDDAGFDEFVRAATLDAASMVGRPHILADISSMSRTRITSTVLACASRALPAGAVLDLLYFPSTYSSHKHPYEPLEAFGPLHTAVAGWPMEPDLPLAVVMSLGTEPRRADGIVESLEPDIVSVFTPVGDEAEFLKEIRRENRRVLEVAGEPVQYKLRDPTRTYSTLYATVERLADRARVIIVPLGPKIFVALAVNAALTAGPHVGVWKASAGRGVQPVDVEASGDPVVTRIEFD